MVLFNRIMINLLNTDYGRCRPARSKLAPRPDTRNAAPDPRYQSADTPDWWRLRAALMQALRDFPEARSSVVQALQSLHQDPDASTP
jgi:hypothetical protein